MRAGNRRIPPVIDPAPPLGPVLEIETDQLAALRTRLLAAGCTIEVEDPSLLCCYFRDPFGLIFNVRTC